MNLIFHLLVFMRWRWGRYLLAGIVLFCAIGMTVSAFTGSTIKTKSGTVAQWNTDSYESSLLTLTGDAQKYQFVLDDFTPMYQDRQFAAGSQVTIWYTESLVGNPSLVAIQATDPQTSSVNNIVTDVYEHPENIRNNNLVAGGVFYALTLVLVVVATIVPTASRKRRQPAGYGSTVVGAGPATSASQDYRPPEHGGPRTR